MSSNSSALLAGWCSIFTYSNISISAYYQTTLAACIVTALLAPITVAGNALVLAAIWRNPSLRTPSFVLLAGLALTDVCTGLLTQPLYVIFKLAELTRKENLMCTSALILFSVSMPFCYLTMVVIAMTAVERWLYMSRRSLLTVRRVVIVFMLMIISFVAGSVHSIRYPSYAVEATHTVILLLFPIVCLCVIVFSYFKVFRIIRHHQIAVQANQTAIDILKYRKSIFTILYVLSLFVLSYFPFVCCALVFYILQYEDSSTAALNACTVVLYSSSFLNPLLYCWRIKELRICIKGIVKNLFCQQTGEEEEV